MEARVRPSLWNHHARRTIGIDQVGLRLPPELPTGRQFSHPGTAPSAVALGEADGIRREQGFQ